MTHSTVFVGNDWRLKVTRLTNASGSLVASAAVTLESLVDRQGTAVAGLPVPAAFTPSPTSPGDYELQISRTVSLIADRRYYATVRAEFASVRGEWRETIICERRVG